MFTIPVLKLEYSKRKQKINKRLAEFKEFQDKPAEELFIELCFCLCTPMSKASRVMKVVNEKNKDILLNGSIKQVSNLLKGYARFHNNKARNIVCARNYIPDLKKLPKDGKEARQWLVKNICGISLKESSHFLRNIGYKHLAIIDIHIIRTLHSLGVFKTENRPKNEKEYENLEKQIEIFANQLKIDMDELDMLIWSIKTGIILK